MSLSVKTPGKLYIAGEYAVLVPKQGAILKNIPIYMTAEISRSREYHIRSDMFDYAVDLTPDGNYRLIQEAIQTFALFLESRQQSLSPFQLLISGKMEKDGKKFGLGSSGSVLVLTLKALSALYELHLSDDYLFKLAAYTLIRLGDQGSMGDIACIVSDQLIYYQSFDRQQIARWAEEMPLDDLLEKDWGYIIEPIRPAVSFDFLVGWTRQPAITSQMIDEVKSSMTPAFLKETQTEVVQLCQSLKKGEKEAVKKALHRITYLLEDLHPAIYTKPLKRLKAAAADLDVVCKSSGSGGGDCGIALSFSEKDSAALIDSWQQDGITLLYQEKGIRDDQS